MTCAAHKSLTRQQGAVLAEMALVTPILVFLILATADITQAFIDHNTLTKAIRNGARYAAANALEGTTGTIDLDAGLVVEIQNLVVYGSAAPVAGTPPVLPGFSTADVSVVQQGADNVEISAVHTPVSVIGVLLPSFWGGPGISTVRNLQATVTMRAL